METSCQIHMPNFAESEGFRIHRFLEDTCPKRGGLGVRAYSFRVPEVLPSIDKLMILQLSRLLKPSNPTPGRIEGFGDSG